MSKKPMGVAIDKELHAEVKSAASLRGMNLESAYDVALRQWLGKAEASPGVSPRNAKYHAMLEEFLNQQNAGVEVSPLVRETVAYVKRMLELHGSAGVGAHRKK